MQEFLAEVSVREKSSGNTRGNTPYGLWGRAWALRRAGWLQPPGVVGLDSESPLFDERFDDPQGVWRPIFEGHGTYTDSSGKIVDLSPATFNDPWPDAPGLSLVPG